MSERTSSVAGVLLDLASQQPGAAVTGIRQLAEHGDSGAQFVLAQLLIEGRGIDHDAAEALYWFQLAASAGHARAANMVGRCHQLGVGTPINVEIAAAWYRRAASTGLDWGMYNLAHLHATGRGVMLDQRRARELYAQAAERGHAKSMNMIGRYFEEGIGGECNASVAIDWYWRAARAGDFRGKASIATVELARGDTDAAVRWLEQAIEAGSPTFLKQLAAQLEASAEPRIRALRSRFVLTEDVGLCATQGRFINVPVCDLR